MTTDRPMNSLVFRLMALEFRIKARRNPPERLLEEAGIEAGDVVLDFGCGPGRYTIPAARMAGEAGRVYGLDLHPLAIRYTEHAARRAGLGNVVTIQSDGPTGLPDASVDRVLLYDTLHDVADPATVLAELRRVLRPGGVLSFRDHRMGPEEVEALAPSGAFEARTGGLAANTFVKASHT